MLVELTGVFDEITRHAVAGIALLDAEIMQRVAEFMKQRPCVIQRDQHRLALGAFGEIIVVGAEQGHRAVEGRRAAIACHPRAGALAGTGKIIAVEQPDKAALAVADFPHPHVRREQRHRSGDFLEAEAIQFFSRPVGSIDDVIQLEIRLELSLVEIIARLAHFFGVKAVIPGLDGKLGLVAIGNLLHVGDFLRHPRNRRRPDAHHQRGGRCGGLCHRVLHAPVGMRRKTQ